MKKLVLLCIILICLIGNLSAASAEEAESNYILTVNGTTFEQDYPPIVENDAVYVPLWGIAGELGVTLEQNGKSRTFRMDLPNKILIFTTGSNLLYQMDLSKSNFNNNRFAVSATRMELPVISKEDVVYIPVIFLSNYMDASIAWEGQAINVTSPSYDITESRSKLVINSLIYDTPNKFWNDKVKKDVIEVSGILSDEAAADAYWSEHMSLWVNKYYLAGSTSAGHLQQVTVIGYDGFRVTLNVGGEEETLRFKSIDQMEQAFYTSDPLEGKGWPDKIKKAIRETSVIIGMNAEQAELAWGKPTKVNKTVNSFGTMEQWVYRSSTSNLNASYLYFNDGILSSVQN